MRDTIFELPVYFPSWLNILPADGNERQLANGGKNKIINKYPVIFIIASCARSRGRVMFSRAKYSYLIVAYLSLMCTICQDTSSRGMSCCELKLNVIKII